MVDKPQLDEKYHKLLAEVIARGDPIVPLSQCGLVKNGTFSILTIQRWIDVAYFPHIKIGLRRYTSDAVIAQWIADGQMCPDVFGLDGRKAGSHFLNNGGILNPREKKQIERQELIDAGIVDQDEGLDDIDDADLYRVD